MGVSLMAVRMSLMRLLVVKKSVHGSLLLLLLLRRLLKSTARMHVRVAPRVEAPVLLPVHVHIEAQHLRLTQRTHAGLHGSRQAASVKARALVVGAHVQSRLG